MPKTYTFHVSLPGTGRVWRKVELLSDQTLENLHFAIQDAFGFDNDHLYSFFMSGKAWDTATEYSLPEGVDSWGMPLEDEGEEENIEMSPEEREANLRELLGDGMTLEEMEAYMDSFWKDMLSGEDEEDSDRDVRNKNLESLNLRRNQTFLYLFDYGDEWRFKVRVSTINSDAPEADYPRLVESVGEAPEQYPGFEE